MKKEEIKCGIYMILNKVNKKKYIGGSINIDKRIKQHFDSLKKNSHKNKRLQNSYNVYGKDNFIHSILKLSDEFNLLVDETNFIIANMTTNEEYGFNINLPIAESNWNLNICMTEPIFWEKLITSKISKSDIELFSYLTTLYGENDSFTINNFIKETLSKKTNKSITTYYASTKKLLDNDFIYSLGKKVYKINPNYFFKGNIEDKIKAIKEMDNYLNEKK